MRLPSARLGTRPAVLFSLLTFVVLALAGTALVYAQSGKSVTLSVDGVATEVSSRGETVADVLDEEGLAVGEHDIVAPSPDEQVSDGDRITVRFGRQLVLDVDGAKQSYWVTATDVASALAELGRSYGGAELSASRSAEISRSGMSLRVTTPKTVMLQVGADKPVRRVVPASTVGGLLTELDVRVDDDDRVRPRLGAQLEDGDKVVVTRFSTVRRVEKGVAVAHETQEQTDDSMYEDEETVTQDGVDGLANVTYRVTIRNGEVIDRKRLSTEVTREPVTEIVTVGTQERPEPEADYSGGGTVWDALAQCESGGNWAINTGNGYYGGLQFSLSTWHAYGGPGYPHEQSRETQIMIAERVRAATGGYGSWPHCSASLGLPQ